MTGQSDSRPKRHLWSSALVLLAFLSSAAALGDRHQAVRAAAPGPQMWTLAGTGSAGYSGDGGLATGATLAGPTDLALDRQGNLYIADTLNNVVREVAASTGLITTVAGTGSAGYSGDGGPALKARLAEPAGLAVDGQGNLFIADGSDVVREVHAGTGLITTVAGTGSAGYSGDGGPATRAQLNSPGGITVDVQGNLFIADTLNNVVREVHRSSGLITSVAGTGLAGDSGDGRRATRALLNNPTGVAVDLRGNLFIADAGNAVVREVSAHTGTINIVVGGSPQRRTKGESGSVRTATLGAPLALTVDPQGDLFVVDTLNVVVREVHAGTALITTVAGTGTSGYSGDGGPATKALLNGPSGISVDRQGDLFIADTLNNVVREVEQDG